MLKEKAKRENLEYHKTYNYKKIVLIQLKYKARFACPKKINVPRFKELFNAYLLGWKERRIMGYLYNLPKVREAIDYIKLRNDIKEDNPTDLFSLQILEKYPEMIKIFKDSFLDLNENTVWIK